MGADGPGIRPVSSWLAHGRFSAARCRSVRNAARSAGDTFLLALWRSGGAFAPVALASRFSGSPGAQPRSSPRATTALCVAPPNPDTCALGAVVARMVHLVSAGTTFKLVLVSGTVGVAAGMYIVHVHGEELLERAEALVVEWVPAQLQAIVRGWLPARKQQQQYKVVANSSLHMSGFANGTEAGRPCSPAASCPPTPRSEGRGADTPPNGLRRARCAPPPPPPDLLPCPRCRTQWRHASRWHPLPACAGGRGAGCTPVGCASCKAAPAIGLFSGCGCVSAPHMRDSAPPFPPAFPPPPRLQHRDAQQLHRLRGGRPALGGGK